MSCWLRDTERSLPLALVPSGPGAGGRRSAVRRATRAVPVRDERRPQARSVRPAGISLCSEHAEVPELPQLLAAPARRESRRLQADPAAPPHASAVVRAEASAHEGGVGSVGYSNVSPMVGTDPNGRAF